MPPLLLPGLVGMAGAMLGLRVYRSRHIRTLLRQLGEQAACTPDALYKQPQLAGELPAPVARYLDLALGESSWRPRLAVLRQTGMLRTDTRSKRWWPFQATHSASARCPGFVWNAQVRMAPGLHLRVVDSLVDGAGAGEVLLMSALRVEHERDRPEMNAGALHRYLAEAPWYPWALLPSRQLSWQAGDDDRAVATLHDGGTSVSLEFRFAPSGEVTGIYSPGRWGKFPEGFRQVPWEGHFRQYERHAGVLVPTRAEVGWYRDAGLQPVWQGQVRSIQWAA